MLVTEKARLFLICPAGGVVVHVELPTVLGRLGPVAKGWSSISSGLEIS